MSTQTPTAEQPERKDTWTGQTGFLLGLAHDAVLRTLLVLKFAADAEPFVMALVNLLFRAVQHQIVVIFLNINQRCIAHQNHLTFCLLL